MKTLFSRAERKELREEAEGGAAAFTLAFLRRHSKLASVFRRLRLQVKDGHGPRDHHGEARQIGDHEIVLFPKFWELPKETQDFVFAHEVGHAAFTQYGSGRFIKRAGDLGVEVWDVMQLPYAQHNMDEAFADSFAAYFLEHAELKRRYPAWLGLVEAVLGK